MVLSDIYSAGEPDSGQISGLQVAKLIGEQHPQVHFQPTLASISTLLTEILKPGDLALFLGAGNLNQIIPEVMAFYQNADSVLSQVVN